MSQGQLPGIVDWKYFDPTFGAGCERGYVYVQDGKIVGFLGLIPFRTNHMSTARAAWSCDWFRDETTPGATAIMLIKETLRSYDFIYSLGGGEKTQAILPRLARTTVRDAGLVLHKPLRLGGIAKYAARQLGLPPSKHLSLLNVIPTTSIMLSRGNSRAKIQTALNGDLAQLLDANEQQESFSDYDLNYIQWQMDHCPMIVSFSCIVPAYERLRAAVLFWRHVESSEIWRLALFPQRGSLDELEVALDHAIHYIYKQGGAVISVLLSRLQTDTIQLLRAKGFIAAKRRLPLYLISRDPKPQEGELGALSFLDTDLAYRFSMVTGD